MESLIKLRFLGSQLNKNELQYFIQQLFQMFGTDIILSFLFNHFLIKYKQNAEHDNNLQIIISLILNIIHERKNNKKSDDSDKQKSDATDKKPIFSLNKIPSEIIGEIASYLKVKEYFDFSKTNRNIYISCNSPNKLQELSTYKLTNYNQCNMNKLVSLNTLRLSIPEFNEYIMLHPKQKQLNRLNMLGLYDATDNDSVTAFMNTKCINFENISYLSVAQFSDEFDEYDFGAFIDMLEKFSNLISLVIDDVCLNGFDRKNISKLFPKLSMIGIGGEVNDSVLLLRNELLKIHSNNITSLVYNEASMDINVLSFPKLKELAVTDPNINSLLEIIETSSDLERIWIEIYELQYDMKKLKELVISILKKCSKLQRLQFKTEFTEMQNIMQFIQIGLLEWKGNSIIYESITFDFTITYSNIKMNELNLIVSGIIEGLDTANVNNFMVGIHIPETPDNTLEETSKIFAKNYLTALYRDTHSLIMSNKNCTINGYSLTFFNNTYTY